MATSTVRSADLDFTNIKARLKDYLSNQPQYSSYDFEASGLSNILDVMAYNTHVNALTANFSLNEAFLSTAQLRSSVVSHATMLGYEIRSRSAAYALINLSVNLAGVANRPAKIEIPTGKQFTSSIDGTTYTFRSRESVYASDDGTGLYVFKTSAGSTEIPIYEGVEKTKTFIVGEKTERQVYIIPDETIDISTANVLVYDTVSSSSFTTYTPLSFAIQVDANSTHFSILEAPNGFYELNFGDGISFGKSPEPGEKVIVTYLSSKGAAANNGTVFSASSGITLSGTTYTLGVVTNTESTGGAERQSIESIRQLAPIAYASQKRLVTSLDYKAAIESNFPQVRSASVWSGDQNLPIDYGKVFISLNFTSGTSTAVQQAVKDSFVTNYTNNLSVMSMTTEFVEPAYVYLEVNTQFQFDPALTGFTLGATETQVYNYMKTYFSTQLNDFNSVFRKSNLATEIDALDKSILSTSIAVKMQMRFNVVINNENTGVLYFPATIASPDDVFNRIQTDAFEFNGVPSQIKNRLNSTVLEIVDLDGNVLLDNVGSYSPENGTVTLIGFNPSQVISGQNYIKVNALPQSDGYVAPLRNYILRLDPDRSSATALVDRQTPSLKVNI
jgi:hypothetical protein